MYFLQHLSLLIIHFHYLIKIERRKGCNRNKNFEFNDSQVFVRKKKHAVLESIFLIFWKEMKTMIFWLNLFFDWSIFYFFNFYFLKRPFTKKNIELTHNAEDDGKR